MAQPPTSSPPAEPHQAPAQAPLPAPPGQSRRPLWLPLVLLVAAALGVLVGARLGLRSSSLLPGQPAEAVARPTIVVASAATLSPVTAGAPSPQPSAPTPEPEAGERTYVVQPGDTMRSIAEQVYGDPSLWPRIYDANRDAIGPDPDALQPDTQLRIPPA